jgi:hypothetical protein
LQRQIHALKIGDGWYFALGAKVERVAEADPRLEDWRHAVHDPVQGAGQRQIHALKMETCI